MKPTCHFRIALPLLFASLLNSCIISSQVNSFYVSGERVEIRPIKAEERGLLPVGPLLAALAPSVINFATGKIKEVYARKSETYVASYAATYVGEDFYESDTSLEFNFGGVEIRRYASEKGSGKEVTASTIKLQWITNQEHTLFALLPQRLLVEKAKARMRSGDRDLDLSIQITLEGYWQVKNGEIRSKTLGDAVLVLKNIRLGETYILGGDGEQTWLEDSNGGKSNFNVQTTWMSPVPVSVSDQGNRLEHARGNYALSISVTEVDDYGERVARFGRDIYDSRAVLIELLEQSLD